MPYPTNSTLTVGPSAFLSTNLNGRIQTYDLLAERIFFELGAPLINIEIACPAAYDFIAQAIEMYTKFCGFTEECLVFNSDLYIPGAGLRLDVLFSSTPEMTATYIDSQSVSSTYSYDYDLLSYRKVVDVFSFEEGTSTGINTLFTIEQSMAQQMHFAYGMGAKGFDIVTWHILKDWLKLREKMFATRYYVRFDDRTQVMRLFPEPGIGSDGGQFWGMIGCYVERPVKDIIREKWVHDYAAALVKIAVARTRGKFNGTQLFGGGNVEWQSLLAEGQTEKKELTTMLYEGKNPDSVPIQFFHG